MDFADRLRAALADRYEIERELGRGGMAVVHLARDLKHDRRVAIKVLRPEVSAALGADRFLREIQIAARLQHPHILPLYDSGQADGLLYYVMPYVEGETLRERIRREKQLAIDDALQICREVADALSYAHSHDLVHRDIKPENVLLSGGHAMVADFGIARAVSAAGGDQLTDSGVAIGTPAYMSPEQGTGEAHLDGRTDIYALGCVLFEMLAGEPPFTGPTGQAIIARHVSERPPSLRIVRPTVSEEIEEVVETALAKVPADRFATAVQFAEAIHAFETGAYERHRVKLGPRGRITLAAVTLLVLVALVWRGVVSRVPLDPNRVVVYPLVVNSDDPAGRALGEGVAAWIGYALDRGGSLRWIEGWRILDELHREDIRLLTSGPARALARARGAGFFLDGRVVLRGDSADVMLALHDVRGDSVVRTASESGLAAEPWRQGLRAVVGLLPVLIPLGKPVDVSALSDRHPTAVAHFLEAEREYRRGRFADALPRYQQAVEVDSLLAIAALKGAQAASWNRRLSDAETLVRVALAHPALLAPRYGYLARGFAAYLAARADSAVHELRKALELDPEWPEAWMALGEVYWHLLPNDSPLDSLAEAAFAEVHRLDPGFVPVLYHLLEITLRKGEVHRATRLMRQFRAGRPDSAELVPTELMLRCIQESPLDVDWPDYTRTVPNWVVDVGRSLTVGGLRQPRCAEAAWRAVLEHDTSIDDGWQARRWGALLGLQSVLVATGRIQELRRLLDAETVFGADLLGRLYMLDAIAGAPVETEAISAAQHLRKAYRSDPTQMSSVRLWHLGVWEAHRGRAGHASAIADTLAVRAARSGDRETRLLATSVAARGVLALPDSANALRLLLTLVPDTGRSALTWYAWESLGGERLALAELLFARGEFAKAFRVAANFDAPAPVPYSIYLPASLVLRLRAARALGDERTAGTLQARLEALGRNDLEHVER